MAQPTFYDYVATDYGEHEAAMRDYRGAGTQRALELGNRGPLLLTADGRLQPDIVAAYEKAGFYVFTGVIASEELADIEADVIAMWDNAPVEKGAAIDRHGRPALAAGSQARTLSWVKPLSDPIGGTAVSHGRHPAKMIEPTAPGSSPRAHPATGARVAAVLGRVSAPLRPSRSARWWPPPSSATTSCRSTKPCG